MCLLEALDKMEASRAKQLQAKQKWEEARVKWHDDHMQRFDRLIDILAKQQGSQIGH